MRIYEVSKTINDLIVFKPDIYRDFRGENAETFNPDFFYKALAIVDEFRVQNLKFVVDSFSFSRKDVLRGFHGDTKAWKLVQCLKGSIYFAVIDLRKESPTYKNVVTMVLDDKDRHQVLVPRGCVNAHLCLSEECIFFYKLTYGYVEPENQITLKWSDKDFASKLNWPITNPIVSLRDK